MTSSSVQSDFLIGDVVPDNLRHSVLHAVLPAMHDGYIFQGKDGVIQGYNQAACRILRMTPEQLVGRTSLDPDWQAIREDGSDFPGELHPIMVSLNTGNPCYGVVMGIQTSKGPPRWLQINSQAIFDEEKNEVIGAVAVFGDITPQVSMLKALANSNQDDDETDPMMVRLKLQKTMIDLTEPFQASIEAFKLVKEQLQQDEKPKAVADAVQKIDSSHARILGILSELYEGDGATS